ncbi:MAG TPA: ABC-type transport auxiliary lipoprotein family protein [Methylotenera sp.]|nr:ABC-type transport auxiliary lipoprotein family protein [Methylotenera sp.]
MNRVKLRNLCQSCMIGFAVTMIGGCSALLPASPPQSSYYSLDGRESRPNEQKLQPAPMVKRAMIINTPRAAAGYDSQHIIYVRQAHKLEYFAHSEWIDTPARMLAPLLVNAIEDSHAFSAVVQYPNHVIGDVRLDSEIIRLQQEFTSQPSKVRFTLRVYLVDNLTKKVIAWREFDETAIATSDDPLGGIVAANIAVQAVLEKLTVFCNEVFS